MAVVIAIAIGVAFLLLAGAVERGYLTRFWARNSRLGRGRRYGDDDGGR
ncbi:MAG TPA: hypothetical protein VFA19_04825 [Gaiellaceae bacterium]|nr:hypothetical protein [Gaiellaceae bacterium]